jgi:flagellar hook protein FlgE
MAFDSLFIGVSGLTAYQEQIDVISNNIANVGTIGYKGQSVTFEDLLYQSQRFASAPSQRSGGINAQQVGDGVRIGAIDTDFAQGGVQTTGIATNLAIIGDGFFALNNVDGSGTTSYTRDGNFSLNQDGYLYDPSSGLAVLGYPVQTGGSISQVAPPQPIQIPFGLKSIAVGTGFGAKSGPTGDKQFDISLGGNLNQTDYITAVSSAGVSVQATTITTTVYDSLGGSHQVQITYQPNVDAAASGTGATLPAVITTPAGVAATAATEWSYTVTSTDGSLDGASTVLGTGYIFFDQNGQFINTSSDPLGANAAAAHVAGQPPSATAGGNLFTVTQWNGAAGANNATLAGSGTAHPAAIGLDFSYMTSLATASTANTVAQNGSTPGILSNITIGQDGTVTGAFTNGLQMTLGRLALASFQNEGGLTRLGGNRFTASANSGIAEYGFAGNGRLGAIDSGALEQSNVSIASEFTKMILAQRSFEANAKSITTADENLRVVIGLKR